MATPTAATHLAALILGAVLAATGTWHVQNWRYAAIEAERVKDEKVETDKAKVTVRIASEGLETDKARIEVKYKTITKTVTKFIDRPIYQNVCLDQDGIDAINGVVK